MNAGKNYLGGPERELFRGIEEERNVFERTTVYINAGGKGSRLNLVAKKYGIPGGGDGNSKALIKAGEDGDTLIDHHAGVFLKTFGFGQVIVGAGNHFNIRTHFEKKGPDQRLSVINTLHQKGTAGDLIEAVRHLDSVGENILVENVDTFVYVDNLQDILEQHEQSGAKATIILTTQKGVPNEGAFYVDEEGMVVYSEEANEKYNLPKPQNWAGSRSSSTGIVIINSEYLINFDWDSRDGELSLYEDVLPKLIKTGNLRASTIGTKHRDIGTPENLDRLLRHQNLYLGALDKKYKEQVDKE